MALSRSELRRCLAVIHLAITLHLESFLHWRTEHLNMATPYEPGSSLSSWNGTSDSRICAFLYFSVSSFQLHMLTLKEIMHVRTITTHVRKETFLTSSADEGQWPSSGSSCFAPKKGFPVSTRYKIAWEQHPTWTQQTTESNQSFQVVHNLPHSLYIKLSYYGTETNIY